MKTGKNFAQVFSYVHCFLYVCFPIFKKDLFIYLRESERERARARAWWGGQRERERRRLPAEQGAR